MGQNAGKCLPKWCCGEINDHLEDTGYREVGVSHKGSIHSMRYLGPATGNRKRKKMIRIIGTEKK